MSNKLHYVFNLICDFNIDILSVTETWLTHDCDTSFLNIPGYEFYRGDTAGSVKKHGAGLYVSKSLVVLPVVVQIPNVVAIFLPELELYVVSIYRPPSYGQRENEALADFLVGFSLGKELLVMGDFNLPTLFRADGEGGSAQYICDTH